LKNPRGEGAGDQKQKIVVARMRGESAENVSVKLVPLDQSQVAGKGVAIHPWGLVKCSKKQSATGRGGKREHSRVMVQEQPRENLYSESGGIQNSIRQRKVKQFTEEPVQSIKEGKLLLKTTL